VVVVVVVVDGGQHLSATVSIGDRCSRSSIYSAIVAVVAAYVMCLAHHSQSFVVLAASL